MTESTTTIKDDYVLPRPLPITDGEREVFSPSAKPTVSQWAESNRVLTSKTSAVVGPWSNEYVPFMVEPMNAMSDLMTREVWICAPGQASKTEVGNNFFGWAVDNEPGPMIILMPTKPTVTKRVNTRIKPMFEASKSLMKHLYNNINNINIGKETVLDNMILYLAWSGSPDSQADSPCRYIWIDEVGKMDFTSATGEASPVDNIRVRATTYDSSSKLLELWV